MNRALRAATVGVLLLAPITLSACGSGQVNQTTTQVRDKTGPAAQVGDLSLRQVELAYPVGGKYQQGDDAQLQMSIANSGSEDDALVGIRGDGFSGIMVTGSGTPTATSSGASSSATPTTAEPTDSSGNRALDIPIPAGQSVFLGENSPTVTLANLSHALTPAQDLKLTFTFRKAGDVTLNVTVSGPTEAGTRTSSYDFSQEPSPTPANQ